MKPTVKRFDTPDDAEAAFYQAIEHADIHALGAVWSAVTPIVCIHPGSARLEGRDDVLQSFRELFTEAPRLSFSIIDALHTGNENLAVHLVREEIALEGQVVSVMVSTNVYQSEPGGWRMLLHHASPEPDYHLDETLADFSAEDFLSEEFDEDDEPAPRVLH